MEKHEYDLTVYEFLKQHVHPCKLTLKRDETIIRCVFCGDSIHDKHDAHFYINNKPPFKFFCQKCNVSGFFNGSIMNKALKLYDKNLSDYLDKSFTDYKRRLNIKYGSSYSTYFNNSKELIFEPKRYGPSEKRKIKYFEDRMGIKLDIPKDLKKYSLILNIYDFFERNEINYKKFNISVQTKIKNIANNHIMFLLYDRNMICCRNITDYGERYYNLSLFESPDDGISKKFYSISNNVNYYNKIFNIHITEGIFDIIGVYNHIYDGKINDNDIFLAANGKGYRFLLNYIMKLGILNCNIFIYSDKDVPKKYYEKFKNNLMITKYNGINIYYNLKENEKDFGVSKDRIKIDRPIII